jgi:hypothetical protein
MSLFIMVTKANSNSVLEMYFMEHFSISVICVLQHHAMYFLPLEWIRRLNVPPHWAQMISI